MCIASLSIDAQNHASQGIIIATGHIDLVLSKIRDLLVAATVLTLVVYVADLLDSFRESKVAIQ